MPTNPKFTTVDNLPIPVPVPRVTDLTPQQRQRAAASMRQGFTLCDLLRVPSAEPFIALTTDGLYDEQRDSMELVGLLYWAAFYSPRTTRGAARASMTKLVTSFYTPPRMYREERVLTYLSEMLPLLLYPTLPMGDPPPADYGTLIQNTRALHAMFPWIPALMLDVQLIRHWFQWSTSPAWNKDLTRRMSEFVARCGSTNLAPWATYTGTMYRGVRRTLDEAKAYDFTNAQVRKSTITDRLMVSFRTSYRSQYPVQSWTASLREALLFAEKGGGGEWGERQRNTLIVPVVFTSLATPQNSLFSPGVSNTIAGKLINIEEDEVIRTTKEIDPAMTGIILLDDFFPWRVYQDWWDSGLFPPAVMEKLRASWTNPTWKGKLPK